MSLHRVNPAAWPRNIEIVYSTRSGGASGGPWAGFNLARHVDDLPAHVDANREQLAAALGPATRIAWLNQVHGARVVEARQAWPEPAEADGVFTREQGMACAVMTADCLPVVLTDLSGSAVAALHAGWRGLARGVLESGVAALQTAPRELLAWLGVCIGATAYEVGPQVRAELLAAIPEPGARDCFQASHRRPGHFLLDLQQLAAVQLRQLGLPSVIRLPGCTASEAERFYSYRRDGVTGRMVTLVRRIHSA